MKSRIEQLLKSERLTSVKFAEVLSVQPSNISHILSGRNNPSYDLLLKIVERFPTVNSEWLLTGKGDVYKSNPTQASICSTNVINDQVTFVNNDIYPNNTKNNDASEDGKTKKEQQECNLTDLPSDILKTQDYSLKQLRKIILIYSDNSFEVFDK